VVSQRASFQYKMRASEVGESDFGMAMNFRSRGLAILSLAVAALFAASTASAQSGQQSSSAIVNANTRFSFKLFHHLTEETPAKNLLVAPTGLSFTFALLDNGADAEARKEIEDALEFTGLDLKQLNEQSNALRAALQLAEPTKLTKRPAWATSQQWARFKAAPPNGTVIADSLWLSHMTFPDSFLQVSKQYYGVDVKRLLAKPSPSEQISRWAAERTRTAIPIHPGTIAKNDFFLVDVTYFHEFWEHKFYESKPGPFTLLNGQTKQVPMMYQTRYFDYFEGPKLQAIVLPYGRRAAMYVFLPSEDSSLSELEKSLTAVKWQQWLSQFESRRGHLGLPRFQIETGFDVRAALMDMGVRRAFESFSAFLPVVPVDGAKLTQAIQKTRIKVDEQGTEAISIGLLGGVPGGIPGGSLGPPPTPFEMIVNRPFFFAIADVRTGQLLFLGAVVEP
jgi:serine protease inhibitor